MIFIQKCIPFIIFQIFSNKDDQFSKINFVSLRRKGPFFKKSITYLSLRIEFRKESLFLRFIWKFSFVYLAIFPRVYSVALFSAVYKSSFIEIPSFWNPDTLPMRRAVHKIACISSFTLPIVNTFPMESIVLKLAFIFISWKELLYS